MAAARNSGSKMVALAVTATLGAVGVGTIYLPFIADKDVVRGLHEEGEMTARDRREYEKVMRELGAQMPPKGERSRSIPTSNSMWKRMNQAAGQQK